MNNIALGQNIKLARKDKGITSEQLSELCNINATYLRQIEKGIKTPSLQVFVTICQNLHVSPHFLLSSDLPTDKNSVDMLQSLIENASPKQLDLIYSMIDSAIKYIKNE